MSDTYTIGQRVVVLIGNDWHYATVLGINTGTRQGIELAFDYDVNGVSADLDRSMAQLAVDMARANDVPLSAAADAIRAAMENPLSEESA